MKYLFFFFAFAISFPVCIAQDINPNDQVLVLDHILRNPENGRTSVTMFAADSDGKIIFVRRWQSWDEKSAIFNVSPLGVVGYLFKITSRDGISTIEMTATSLGSAVIFDGEKGVVDSSRVPKGAFPLALRGGDKGEGILVFGYTKFAALPLDEVGFKKWRDSKEISNMFNEGIITKEKLNMNP